MNTKPLVGPAECLYERIDEKHQSYACDAPAVIIWLPEPHIQVPLCKSCALWLATLISLGQKP